MASLEGCPPSAAFALLRAFSAKGRAFRMPQRRTHRGGENGISSLSGRLVAQRRGGPARAGASAPWLVAPCPGGDGVAQPGRSRRCESAGSPAARATGSHPREAKLLRGSVRAPLRAPELPARAHRAADPVHAPILEPRSERYVPAGEGGPQRSIISPTVSRRTTLPDRWASMSSTPSRTCRPHSFNRPSCTAYVRPGLTRRR